MQAIAGTDDAKGMTMRNADAIELLDVRAFITTRSFGGELFRIYERGDREEMECETQFYIDKNSKWQDAAFKAIEVLVLKYKYFTLHRE